jgi:hypothetical protein
MLLEKFQRDHATQDAKGVGRRTIIATQMPPAPVIRSLYGEMIRALNGNLRPTARFYELEIVANQLRMTIVAAGTHEALHVLRFDPQIASRGAGADADAAIQIRGH